MKAFVAIAILGICWAGLAASGSAQQAVPPEIERPAPVHMPPDFQGNLSREHPPRPAFDSAKAQKRAQELAKLADKVPGEVNQVSKNVLPKDLIQDLKRIEKLAKQLRGQISQ